MDDVIESSMMEVTTSTETAAETMESKPVNCYTTMLARMWAT